MSDFSIDWTIIGLALTIIALALSVWQTWAAHRQTKELAAISNALSTRYIGNFPEHLSYIKNLVESANRELLILRMIPTMSQFSDPDKWLSIKHCLEKALMPSRKVNVKCIFGDPTVRRELYKDRFQNAAKDWNAWRNNPSHRVKIKHIFDKNDFKQDIQNISFDDFLDLLEQSNVTSLKNVYKGAEIVEVQYRFTLYLFIADGKEAIYIVQTLKPNFIAHAFWTSDMRLIGALTNMHREFFESGKRLK